jgi:type VII secretion integral membrane protein EccD
VVTSTRWAEVGVPADLPLADLLPALVVHVGDENLAEQPVVLQRLGASPLNEDLSPLALGIRDGDTLYLRPQPEQLPPIRFDDLVDGVASGVRARPGWSVPRLRGLFFALAAATTLIALGLLLLIGDFGPVGQRPVLAGVGALAGLVGAAVLGRQEWGRPFAHFLVSGVLLPCTAAGSLLLAGQAAAVDRPLGSPSLAHQGVWLGATMLAVVLVSALLVPGCGPLLAAFGLLALGLAGGGLASAGLSLDASDTGVLVLAVSTLVGQLLPTNSYRLAGIQIPILPTRATDLDQNIDPIPGAALLTRAQSAERYFSAMSLAVGALLAGAGVLASRGPDRWTTAFVLTVALLHLVRSRSFIGLGQRVAAVTAGCTLLVAQAVEHVRTMVADGASQTPAQVVLALGVLTVAFTVAARKLPGRPLVPHLGRAAEIVEIVAALAVVPLGLAAMSIYSILRAIPHG